jgi:hydrogenase expression/formation protein HypC
MCVGVPMQVEAVEPGFAWATGRGERRRVALALVGECQPGDWLLVFLEQARERIDAHRAAEIGSALDLLEAALAGKVESAQAAAQFALPSQQTAAALAVLTNARKHTTPR